MKQLQELKNQLLKLGWQIEAGQHSGMAFYAWNKLEDVPDCQSNDKPPCVCVEYYMTTGSDHEDWRSCEVKLVGDLGGQWVSLRAYSIRPDEILEKLPRIVMTLERCWVRAHTAWQSAGGAGE